jgi:hypothetical protein
LRQGKIAADASIEHTNLQAAASTARRGSISHEFHQP